MEVVKISRRYTDARIEDSGTALAPGEVDADEVPFHQVTPGEEIEAVFGMLPEMMLPAPAVVPPIVLDWP